jgi:hypothetical protein
MLIFDHNNVLPSYFFVQRTSDITQTPAAMRGVQDASKK